MSKGKFHTPTVECQQSLRSIQSDYTRFKLENAIKRVFDPVSELYWTYYESSNVRKSSAESSGVVDLPSVVLLHGICGTAGCYFYIVNKLAEAGVRCISAQYPEYYSPDEWIAGLLHFIEYLKLSKPLVFGSDLGGYLLQLFVETYPESVCSIALCNSYRRTDGFSSSPDFRGLYGRLYSVLPHMILRNIYIDSYICPPKGPRSATKVPVLEHMAREFMAHELDQLSASELGSRISLQMSTDYVDDYVIRRISPNRILIIETSNNNIPEELNDDMLVAYRDAKIATMRAGGDFPYLTKPDEIVTFLLVHLTNVCLLQNEKNIQAENGTAKTLVSCGQARDVAISTIMRKSSESSQCSLVPGAYSCDYNDYVTPSLSDVD
ncbi:hypothetical protein X943_003833 [Babesia divergens]|uniref:Maspardin n=1 Tax=Babesia divergens TaxID=32595 RepID=A0AAD9G7V9_BABDI|nr:hypothetical protein X943_003833 [Babesia divergens]